MKQQLSGCLRTTSRSGPTSAEDVTLSKTAPQWVPEQEAEPGTEVKSGDLYLLSGPVDSLSDVANNNRHGRAKLSDRSGTLCRRNNGSGGSISSSGSGSSSSSSSRKRGPSKYPVQVKVYRSCFGHYAVVTSNLRAPATYLNLRTCNCRPCFPTSGSASSSSSPSSSSPSSSSPTKGSPSPPTSSSSARSFRVELGGGEGQVIYFEVSGKDSEGVDSWLRALQSVSAPPAPGTISPSLSPVIPRSPIMPTLQESIEEEDEEDEEQEQRAHGLG